MPTVEESPSKCEIRTHDGVVIAEGTIEEIAFQFETCAKAHKRLAESCCEAQTATMSYRTLPPWKEPKTLTERQIQKTMRLRGVK